MHLDGMKQEEVEKSNLLGTVVAVCPAFVPKVCPETRGNHISLYGFSVFSFLRSLVLLTRSMCVMCFIDSRAVSRGTESIGLGKVGFYLETVSFWSYCKHSPKGCHEVFNRAM